MLPELPKVAAAGPHAAGPAVGTGWAGHLTGEAGRARRGSRGCRVGFRALAHLRGPRGHVRASG